MALALLYSRGQLGLKAPLVQVEVDISRGLPKFSMVGLAELTVKESKDRVRSAILNAGFEFPTRRLTVNLSPADLPKEGGRYDLAIAIGILAASGQLPQDHLSEYEWFGELGLSGGLRGISGCVTALKAVKASKRKAILAEDNHRDAALVLPDHALLAKHLRQVCDFLIKGQPLGLVDKARSHQTQKQSSKDLSDVIGQDMAKRALMIAAAGGHHMLMVGTPGCGKSMLAERLSGILPAFALHDAIELAEIKSYQQCSVNLCLSRPFRNPHHSLSAAALVGGGSPPLPGEISHAHRGVLFLDELPEFAPAVLNTLREPLEKGHITISRVGHQVTFPCRFQLIAAMNPCPCGYAGFDDGRCRCTADQLSRYKARISGPLWDRIDLQVPVRAVRANELSQGKKDLRYSSQSIRLKVEKAIDRQCLRQGKLNRDLDMDELASYAALGQEAASYLHDACDQQALSARSYHRLLRVARSIADIASEDQVKLAHLQEAFAFRRLGLP